MQRGGMNQTLGSESLGNVYALVERTLNLGGQQFRN
jgi:hypothetical protein